MIYHVAQIKLRCFIAWWFMFQQMISTWRFFLGKQKERCEVYVGWLTAIGVLAHFGTEFGRGPNSSENFDRCIILFGT